MSARARPAQMEPLATALKHEPAVAAAPPPFVTVDDIGLRLGVWDAWGARRSLMWALKEQCDNAFSRAERGPAFAGVRRPWNAPVTTLWMDAGYLLVADSGRGVQCSEFAEIFSTIGHNVRPSDLQVRVAALRCAAPTPVRPCMHPRSTTHARRTGRCLASARAAGWRTRCCRAT